jgi:hypothetical protein
MMRTFLSELNSPEARQALAESVLAVLDAWGIHPAKQAELLGLADTAPFRHGQPLPADPDVLERVGHLLGIERTLRRLCPDDPASRQAWLMLPDVRLDGHSPLRVMLEGLEGIKRVRTLLEASP